MMGQKQIVSLDLDSASSGVISLVTVPHTIFADQAAIGLNATKAKVYVGNSITLKLVNAPVNQVKWASGDPSIAMVNARGKVMAKKKGKVMITASYRGTEYQAVITVDRVSVAERTIELPTEWVEMPAQLYTANAGAWDYLFA